MKANKPPFSPPILLAPDDQVSRLDQLILTTARALHGLQIVRLTSDQRRSLGASLCGRSHGMARSVARTLCRRPELFAEIAAPGEMGAKMQRQQQAAQRWRVLAGQFTQLAQVCQDNYLHNEAAPVRQAEALLDQVVLGLHHRALMPHLDHDERLRSLLIGHILLEERRRLHGRRPDKGDKKRVKLSPKQKLARKQRKQRLAQQRIGLFESVLDG